MHALMVALLKVTIIFRIGWPWLRAASRRAARGETSQVKGSRIEKFGQELSEYHVQTGKAEQVHHEAGDNDPSKRHIGA